MREGTFAANLLRKNIREWRFSGDLGFGGKFWHNDGRHYVSYYIEDKTRAREKLVNRLNAAIAELETEFNET